MKFDKEKLVMDYLPLVKYVVDRLPVASLPQVSREDLISSGVIGLLKALESFDPSRGVKFKTYAIPRIRGAIVDELRRLDWVPRSLRKKADLLEKIHSSLERKLGRTPTDKELSRELNISQEDLYKLYTRVNYFFHISLNSETQEEGRSLIEKIASPDAQDPVEILKREEMRKILKKVLEELPVRERMVIVLYYYEELTLKEIGHILGISESRVSQIHGKVILKLRSALTKLRESLIR
jgi:RNA polymerase sigma factor for flagellar operon FliA